MSSDTDNRAAIRDLNDRFRRHGLGRGSTMITVGVQALGDGFVAAAVAGVRDFNAFDRENDPWHEHDFGALEICGEKIFFKIDYYDLSLTQHSPDPSVESVTHRVLTIMLASEY